MNDTLPAFYYLMGEWNHNHPRDFELVPNTAPDGTPRFVWKSSQGVEFDQLDRGDIIDHQAVGSQTAEDFSALVAALATAHQRTDFALDTARLVAVNEGDPRGGEVEVKSNWSRQWQNDELSDGDLLDAVSETWQAVDTPSDE